MKPVYVLLLVFFCLSGGQPAYSDDPAVGSQTFNVEVEKAVKFKVNATTKLTDIEVVGIGAPIKGKVVVTNGLATGSLTTDVKFFTTDWKARDEHMVKSFKASTAVSFSFADVKITEGEFTYTGLLTINNVTKTLTAKATKKGQSIKTKFTVLRKDFNVVTPEVKLIGAKVDEKVEIEVNFKY